MLTIPLQSSGTELTFDQYLYYGAFFVFVQVKPAGLTEKVFHDMFVKETAAKNREEKNEYHYVCMCRADEFGNHLSGF